MDIKRILNLHNLPRIGWVLRGVSPIQAETVSSHTFLTSLLAMDIAYTLRERGIGVDIAKVLTISLIHDVPEAVIGDVVRYVKKGAEDYFHDLELRALKDLGLDGYLEFFREYISMESLEAVVVKIADSLATVLEGKSLASVCYPNVKELVDRVSSEMHSLVNEKLGGELRDIVLKIIDSYIGSI